MMVLEALRVWRWRGLDAALEGLSPDLDLVVGPNESGKSRLFEALHHALFERYKGSGFGKADLQGWHTDEPPEVEVVFVADGHRYTLHKRFLKHEFARLEGAGHTWRDDDAEARVRALLGTREFDRKLTAEHMGIWPLVWLPQGASAAAPHEHLTEDGRARIRDVLAAEVDQVAAGPAGQHVLKRIAEEHARYWSRGRGLATGELKAARDALAAAEAARDAAVARRDAARELATSLAAAQADLAAIAPRVTALRGDAETAAARWAAARDTLHDIEVQEAQVAQHRSAASQAEAALRAREAAVSEIGALERQILEVRGEAQAAAGEEARLGELLAGATGAAEAAATAEQQADARLDLAARYERRRDLARTAVRKREACEQARAVRERLAAAEAALRGFTLDPLKVETLRKGVEEHRVAAARLDAAAVAVRLVATRDLVVDGEPLAAGATREWRVRDARAVEVEGVLRVEVSPGEGTLAALRDAEHDAARGVERLLARYEVASLAEAEERLAARRQAADAVTTWRERLAARAPDGFDTLEREALDAETALARLEGLPSGEALALPLAPVRSEPHESRDEAGAALRGARTALQAARATRDALAGEAASAREAILVARARLDTLAADLARRTRKLAEDPAEADLVAARDAARRALLDTQRRLETLRVKLDEAGGEDARADDERAARALAVAEQQHADLTRRAADLRAKLEVHGGEKLHEDVLEAEARVEAARARAGRVEARALAARRLHEALDTARHQAQERLLAPVRARVEPYLHELFPGSSLDLDPEWQVHGLRTADTREPFDLLSGGAREQLSVIVRLGLAEVLARGERLPVVLDDALVNSDHARLEQMLRVLYRAARGLQVLVFSCHEVAFDRLGASRVYRLPAPVGTRFPSGAGAVAAPA